MFSNCPLLNFHISLLAQHPTECSSLPPTARLASDVDISHQGVKKPTGYKNLSEKSISGKRVAYWKARVVEFLFIFVKLTEMTDDFLLPNVRIMTFLLFFHITESNKIYVRTDVL